MFRIIVNGQVKWINFFDFASNGKQVRLFFLYMKKDGKFIYFNGG